MNEFRIIQVSPDGQHQPTRIRTDDPEVLTSKLDEFRRVAGLQRTGWTYYAERREVVGTWERVP